MKSGLLDRRITIQSKAVIKDSYGEPINVWSTFLSVWAMKVQKDGREETDNNNRGTQRMINFRVRWNDTFTNEMRILYNSEYYKIEDIKELGRQDGLMIMTSLLNQT